MAQIRDSSIIRTPEVTIDPRFTFPDDVIDLKQNHHDEDLPEAYDDNDYSAAISEVTLDQTVPSNDVLSEPETAHVLHAPQYLSIVSQTVRISSDGTSFVDVVLEAEDVLGADSYEIRITK